MPSACPNLAPPDRTRELMSAAQPSHITAFDDGPPPPQRLARSSTQHPRTLCHHKEREKKGEGAPARGGGGDADSSCTSAVLNLAAASSSLGFSVSARPTRPISPSSSRPATSPLSPTPLLPYPAPQPHSAAWDFASLWGSVVAPPPTTPLGSCSALAVRGRRGHEQSDLRAPTIWGPDPDAYGRQR